MSLKMLEALLFATLGYVMGSVMNGYLLPKYLKGIDITKVSEDHNPGTANVMKYAGVPVGIVCLLFDIGKGYLPVVWATRFLTPASVFFAGILAAPVIGHAYPLWKNSHGGKAIAVSFGVLLGIVRFSQSVFLLAGIYIAMLFFREIRPNERKSVYTFGIFGIAATIELFVGKYPGICIGNMVIALIVMRKNWEGARFGSQEEWKKIKETTNH